MTLLGILSEQATSERRRLLVIANLAGIANTLLLAHVNALAHAPETAGLGALFMFAMLVALHALCTRHVNHRVTEIFAAALHGIKVRVGREIVRAELDALERVRAAEICDRITENMAFISDRAGIIASLMQSSLIVAFLAVYIAWLSLPALGLVAVLCAIGIGLFVTVRRDFVVEVRMTARRRLVFFERLSELLGGFKQVKLDRPRARDLCDEVIAASDSLRVASSRSSRLLSDNSLLGTGILFALLAGTAYVLRQYVHTDLPTLVALVTAVMFLWTPLMSLSLGLLPYVRANLALAEIEALERRLAVAAREAPDEAPEDPWHGSIRTLEARGIEYAYAPDHGEAGFRIGPIDLSLRAGEICFLVGGNGSGKSTLLKVLTGLYAPTAGTLVADGIEVGPHNLVAYREHISAIFSDFHLFERLYGLPRVQPAEAERLLARMGLTGQTELVDGAFSRLALSTGQRKRLAMVIALLEDRKIQVFDEWAADQDPEFRQSFYETLLPARRAEGKLVLAVSHDDRWFHVADQRIELEFGKLRTEVPR